jgi:PAS domain S-box-containing protein
MKFMINYISRGYGFHSQLSLKIVGMIPILCVDDEEAFLEVSKLFLEKTGDFQVLTAPSAPAALGLLSSNGIQAVISDFQMPEMDGIEFLKKVRATDKLIPFIMFTGKGREEIAAEAFENGADFYIQKGGEAGAQFGELVHKIHAAVDHRHAEEQRTMAENNLRASELRYRRLFETAQDAILILDGDTGLIIDANRFILDLLGYPLEYFIGRHLWELGFVRDKPIAETAFNELKTKGYIRYEDLPLETKDGRVIDVEFVSNVYFVGEKRIIQCNIRDITVRKQAENALALANRKLNLLSSITRHDILNQLTTLIGFLELSREMVHESKVQEFIGKEITVAETIRRLIQFTRDYENMGVSAPVWQNISAYIRKISATHHPGNVKVIVDGPDIEVFADPLLEKVFYNLIDNALRYGGEKMKSVRVTAQEKNGSLVLAVADDGAGIPPEVKTRLFTKGFGKNTGLGLFLSREILSITGITITENGLPGSGARFEITVPGGHYRFTDS